MPSEGEPADRGVLGPLGAAEGINRGLGAAAPDPNLEDACGVVAVNRVADEALRSPSLPAIVAIGVVEGSCRLE